MNKELKKVYAFSVLFFIIGGLVGYGAGFTSGYISALSWGVDKAMYFLNLKGIEIDVDEGLLVDGIYRYKENIGGCWDIEKNAPIYNNTGN